MVLKQPPSELLELLSDGEFHSGEAIGAVLGISRAAVWKKLQGLDAFDIYIESIKGKGYRLIEPVKLLDKNCIYSALEETGIGCDISVYTEIDSTNAELLRRAQFNQVEVGTIILSESQLAGRGRRGRKWVSPFAKNLYFSMLWSFNEGVSSLDGLSLVVGISLAQVLELLGLRGVQLKWPNDVFVNNRKLAGILLEITGDPTGLCHVVIGVGVNVHMQKSQDKIDQPWVSLDQLSNDTVDRNQLVVSLVKQLFLNLREFEKTGFKAFSSLWSQYDCYHNKEVVVTLGERRIFGIAKGVQESGELIVKTVNGIEIFNGGEVSLRRKL